MTPISKASHVAPKSRMAVWFFWGTIATMTLGTVGLQVAGSRQAATPSIQAQDAAPTRSELTADAFRKALEAAPDAVLDQVLPNLDPLLDRAFQPVYDSIEGYTDFHYSIRGEYTELFAAGWGKLENDLEERLFAGLSDRLNSVSFEMDANFLETYEKVLGEKISMATGSVDLGDATRQATQGAFQRVTVTAPVAAATTVAGAASIKVISKSVAKKIVAKVAVKTAGKGVFKGGSLLTGAGTGAALCAPAGPVAVVCGIVGGVATWLVVDGVVINLDEKFNGEEFEQGLRNAIDDEKKRIRSIITQRLQVKKLELVRMAPQQAQDMTLAQLPSARRLEICETAKNLSTNYRIIQDEIAARNPSNLAKFAANLDSAEQIEALLPLVDDMRASIDETATLARIDGLMLEGNFRTKNRADRDVTAQLHIQGALVNFERMEASETTGFSLSSSLDLQIDTLQNVDVLAAMEQHLRIRSDRFYGGHVAITKIFSSLEDVNGLHGMVRASLPIVLDENAKSLADVHKPQGVSSILNFAMTITAEPLRDPLPFSACTSE